MGLATIVFVLTARAAAKRRTLLWAMAGLSFALVLLSRSATSLVATSGVLVLLPLLYVLRERSTRTVLLLLLMLLILGSITMVVSLNLEAALQVVGKDTSLTGRVPLWKFLVDQVQDRPWLGAGYSAFWMGWTGPSEFVSNVTGGWYPSHAHNGLLNLALQLGGLGVVLFLVGMTTAAYRALRSLRDGPPEGGIFSLSMLGFLVLTSMSESTLLAHDSLFWLLYTVAVFLPVNTSGSTRQPFGRSPSQFSRTDVRVAGRRGGASLGVKRRLREIRQGDGRISRGPERSG
jgi:O-antigen ligase